MPHVVIENPILNSPFLAPDRSFRFDDDGITDEVVAGRRPSSYFVPIPRARKKGQKTLFETEWTQDRIMAMLIAWQTLNKLANPQDPSFSDAFLLVTPGITSQGILNCKEAVE